MPQILLLIVGLATWYDLRARIIPDWLTLPFIVGGTLVSLATRGLWITAGTLLVGGALCEIIYRSGALGGGDLKLLLGVALLTGPLLGAAIAYWSLILSLPIFAFYMVLHRTFRPSVPYALAILAAVLLLHWRGYLAVFPGQ